MSIRFCELRETGSRTVRSDGSWGGSLFDTEVILRTPDASGTALN
jgi:hypothetical protein